MCRGSRQLVPGRSAHETPLEVAPVFESDPADDVPDTHGGNPDRQMLVWIPRTDIRLKLTETINW
ncbi:uncharacterized protein PgNI_08335 [Pyricularia grisea]|uniref:Uncharacterized protein n=1 Tax=Pyricularia grisea TaxID=148305 RepID=A0A6P8AVB4_PYRGI|nr:uncharacterized protein PgNI_08335 [Pyricularia grisea]TLD06104.1 hypothetical protein PgNI_08335 [Pyricularia grisea]